MPAQRVSPGLVDRKAVAMSQGYAWAGGSTTRWRKLRARILAANLASNAGRCAAAISGVCTGIATEVHHVKGRSVTGDDPKWLAALCRACNQHIGDPQAHPAHCFCGWGYARPRMRRVSTW